jgi:uncharacterized protein YjbJ (UPF0337 family)
MSINKHQVTGALEEGIDKVAEIVGKAVGDNDVDMRGDRLKTVDPVQASAGDAEDDFANTAPKYSLAGTDPQDDFADTDPENDFANTVPKRDAARP